MTPRTRPTSSRTRCRSRCRRTTRPGSSRVDDLAKKDVKVALCQADVPCGATALTVFENAGITVTPVTEEARREGHAEQGDPRRGRRRRRLRHRRASPRATRCKGIEIPADVNASTTYPIATLTASENQPTAQALRRLRPLAGRCRGADRGGLQQAVTMPDATRAHACRRRPTRAGSDPLAADGPRPDRHRVPGAAAGRAAGPRALDEPRPACWPRARWSRRCGCR